MAATTSTTTFAEQRAFAAEVAKEEAAVEWAVEQVKSGGGWPICTICPSPFPQGRAKSNSGREEQQVCGLHPSIENRRHASAEPYMVLAFGHNRRDMNHSAAGLR